MNIAQALSQAAGLGVARLDGQLLLLHALGRAQHERAWLLAHDMDELGVDVESAFTSLCNRRATGEPLAYLTGHKEFFGLDLLVDKRVLVPRPDTETLVEWALALLGCHPGLDPGSTAWTPGQARGDKLLVIDLGTGSGAIALAVKHACPGARVEAVDASSDALEVARANAQRLNLDIRFRQASWLTGAAGPYDLILSNPPYVIQDDPHLAALTHEPLCALASGPDGLDDIRQIVSQAPAHLKSGGWLLLEHGYDQADAVQSLLAMAGFREITGRRDLAGITRCTGGKWLELG